MELGVVVVVLAKELVDVHVVVVVLVAEAGVPELWLVLGGTVVVGAALSSLSYIQRLGHKGAVVAVSHSITRAQAWRWS